MSNSADFPRTSSDNEAPYRPKILVWAVILILTAAILFLVLSISQISSYTGFHGAQVIAEQILPKDQTPSKADLEKFNSILPGVIVGQSIATVIFLGTYILIAVFLYRGSNSARIFAALFTMCSLVGLTAGLWIVNLWVLLNTVGTMLTFAPSSNRYFSAVSAFHKAQDMKNSTDA